MKLKILTSLLLAWALLAAAIVTLVNGQPVARVYAAPDESRTSHNVVVNYAPQTLSLTGSQTITPAVSMYLLAPSSLATYTLATGNAVAGDLLILVGSVTTNTVLADTGATGSGGARTIGNGDVWTGYFNGSAWVEESFSDNS